MICPFCSHCHTVLEFYYSNFTALYLCNFMLIFIISLAKIWRKSFFKFNLSKWVFEVLFIYSCPKNITHTTGDHILAWIHQTFCTVTLHPKSERRWKGKAKPVVKYETRSNYWLVVDPRLVYVCLVNWCENKCQWPTWTTQEAQSYVLSLKFANAT